MNHKITITNLGPLKEIKNFEVKKINAIIGESATGKSLLAKAIFAFNEEDFVNSFFDGTERAEAELRNNIQLLLSPYQGFTITYNYGNGYKIAVETPRLAEREAVEKHSHTIFHIPRSPRGHRIKIDFSEKFEKYIKKVNGKIAQIQKTKEIKILQARLMKLKKVNQATDVNIKKVMEDLGEIPEDSTGIQEEFFKKLNILDTIFIPATRSFVSDFDNLRLDFYGKPSARRWAHRGDFPGGDITLAIFSETYRKYAKNFNSLDNKLMRGTVRQAGRVGVKFTVNGQRLDISKVSSGQKELFPILMILQEVEKRSLPVFIIIEEPEVHIFPKDQILILEKITAFAKKTNSKVFVTTHSPYILMELNNLLEANARQYAPMKDKSVNADEASVWMLGEKNKSILNKESKLIGLNYIEEIEAKIFAEFQEIMRSMRKSG